MLKELTGALALAGLLSLPARAVECTSTLSVSTTEDPAVLAPSELDLDLIAQAVGFGFLRDTGRPGSGCCPSNVVQFSL